MAPLEPAICWQAIYSRDARFDGRFFAGATTTGLYCRNVCPVPFARPKNIVLFACAEAAEAAGFRPCKRCQARAAPGTPAWRGTLAVVSRALRLILEGALNEGSVEELAERLGLGARQLRRLFSQHLGASPLKIASVQRVHLARTLIGESSFARDSKAFASSIMRCANQPANRQAIYGARPAIAGSTQCSICVCPLKGRSPGSNCSHFCSRARYRASKW